MWQVEKGLKTKEVSVNIIGNEDEDVIKTPADEKPAICGVIATVLGTKSATVSFQKPTPQKPPSQTLMAGTVLQQLGR